MKEIWKDIKGYEGLYKISNIGNVKSTQRKEVCKNNLIRTRKEKIIKKTVLNTGYEQVSLCKGGKAKSCKVHRLVCEAFLKNPHNKPCVNHIDGNKTNNNIYNLEWVTYQENSIHGLLYGNKNHGENCSNSLLSNNEVLLIRKIYKSRKNLSKEYGILLTYEKIGKMFNVSKDYINNIVNKRTYKNI